MIVGWEFESYDGRDEKIRVDLMLGQNTQLGMGNTGTRK